MLWRTPPLVGCRRSGPGVTSRKERGLQVLFICTGNICRSPTAERLAVAYGLRHGIPALAVASAGTRAVTGHPMHQEAVPVLEELGGDASGFAARQLTPKLASDADLVLTMTRAHRDDVLELAPRLLRVTFTLAEASLLTADGRPERVADLAARRPLLAADRLLDIPDPIGRSRDVFTSVGSQIAAFLPPVLEFCGRRTAG